MENLKTFQLLRVSFKHPDTGKVFSGVCVGDEIIPPSEFDGVFNSDAKAEDVISGIEVAPPMKFEDAAMYPEVKRLLEALVEAMENI